MTVCLTLSLNFAPFTRFELSQSRNIVLKQHFTLSCIYCSVIPTKILLSLLGLKLLLSFHHKLPFELSVWPYCWEPSVMGLSWWNILFTVIASGQSYQIIYNTKAVVSIKSPHIFGDNLSLLVHNWWLSTDLVILMQ